MNVTVVIRWIDHMKYLLYTIPPLSTTLSQLAFRTYVFSQPMSKPAYQRPLTIKGSLGLDQIGNCGFE